MSTNFCVLFTSKASISGRNGPHFSRVPGGRVLISNSRFSRRGPALHRPESQVIRTNAELAGEGSLGAAGSPHRAGGETARGWWGLSCVAHFTLQTLASLAQSFTRGTHEPSQYGLLMQTTSGYWFQKKKMHFMGQIVAALSWNHVHQVWPGAHLWDKHSRPLLLQRHQYHALLLPGKTLLTHLREEQGGTSLMVQWLGFCTSTAGGTGSIPSQGTNILQVSRSSPKKKKKGRGRHPERCIRYLNKPG